MNALRRAAKLLVLGNPAHHIRCWITAQLQIVLNDSFGRQPLPAAAAAPDTFARARGRRRRGWSGNAPQPESPRSAAHAAALVRVWRGRAPKARRRLCRRTFLRGCPLWPSEGCPAPDGLAFALSPAASIAVVALDLRILFRFPAELRAHSRGAILGGGWISAAPRAARPFDARRAATARPRRARDVRAEDPAPALPAAVGGTIRRLKVLRRRSPARREFFRRP